MSENCAYQSCAGAQFKHGLCKDHYAAIAKEALSERKGNGHNAGPPFLKTALYIFNRMTDNLIEGYRRAFELKQDEVLSLHMRQVEEAVQKGAIEQAAQSLEQAAGVAPKDPKISLHLGDLHLQSGDFEQALACYEEVLAADEGCHHVQPKMGEALCGLARHEEAIEYLALAVENDPQRAENYHRLGLALEAAGKTAEAVGAYEQAVELEPSNAGCYQTLGFAYESLGQHEEALSCFKRALELER